MKKILSGLMFLFVVVFAQRAFSQDDIILLNNDVIKGKVTEVGLNTIKYQRADNPDGPAYDLSKNDIYMIVYANGTSDVINPRANNGNNGNGNNNAPQATSQSDDLAAPQQVTTPPPPMPVYEQPYCPAPGYIWTPGYWAWGYAGYYWVPGVWVAPPRYGLLWTPGYWGFGGGFYGWHAGYWGPTIGYYGGIYYGYGYTGHGYYGGRWDGDVFRYNTSVSRVDVTVVHTTYVDNTVVNNTTVNRTSFNGTGGVQAQPTPEEQKAAAAPHVAPTAVQVAHVQTAQSDKTQYASVNGGKPAVTAMNKPSGEAFSSEGKPAALHPNTQPVVARPAATPAARTVEPVKPTPAAEPAKAQPVTLQPAHPAAAQPATVQPASHPAAVQPASAPVQNAKTTAKPARKAPAPKAKPAPRTYSEPSRK